MSRLEAIRARLAASTQGKAAFNVACAVAEIAGEVAPVQGETDLMCMRIEAWEQVKDELDAWHKVRGTTQQEEPEDMRLLLAIIDALPRCCKCTHPATKDSENRASVFCDEHAPDPYEACGGERVSWRDLPYAAALRALMVAS